MKIKLSITLLIITFIFSCQERIEKEVIFEQKPNIKKINSKNDNFKIPHVEVITAELPIKLNLIDFEDIDLVQQISDGKINRIKKEIKDYYLEDCSRGEESPYAMKDIYLKTIQINNTSNSILYWIILKHVSNNINSKILFFDNTTKEFSEYVHDLNIHALYNEDNKRLSPTNLKEKFRLDFPEIELIDFDKDEFADFKLSRLYHNGTANAIEEMVIEVSHFKADTLKFTRDWIRN